MPFSLSLQQLALKLSETSLMVLYCTMQLLPTRGMKTLFKEECVRHEVKESREGIYGFRDVVLKDSGCRLRPEENGNRGRAHAAYEDNENYMDQHVKSALLYETVPVIVRIHLRITYHLHDEMNDRNYGASCSGVDAVLSQHRKLSYLH